jgi:tetratricopeptide (TPR) repeat protein
LVNRGILKLRLERIEDAIADFDAAIGRDPNEAEAYVNKGMAMLRRDGRWSDAVALFDTGLEKRTRRPAIAYFGRAVANEMGGRIKEAYLDYRQASLIEPQWRDPKAELTRFTVRQP